MAKKAKNQNAKSPSPSSDVVRFKLTRRRALLKDLGHFRHYGPLARSHISRSAALAPWRYTESGLMTPRITGSDRGATDIAVDALVVGVGSANGSPRLQGSAGDLDSALDGYISEYLTEIAFKGNVGDFTLIPTHRRIPARSLAIVGVGEKQEVGSVRRAAAVAARKLSERNEIASCLHEASNGPGAVAGTAEGFLLGSYRPPSYKHAQNSNKLNRINLLTRSEDEIETGIIHGEATLRARDLANEPASTLDPTVFAQRAQQLADVTGLEARIWDEDELAAGGFGGLLGVAKGTHNPPRLIELRHRVHNPSRRIALVGKGVTFDSGGLSLKDARGMETMKTDMAGAAAVISVMGALPRLSIDLDVRALIPATENMPGGRALKPGDVIEHYGGRTTEVLNTDAEGRLILADALRLAADEKPDAIIDVATLTGAMSIALGKEVTGVFANDDQLWNEIHVASESAGEPTWRMPLVDAYKKSLDSDVADMKNIGTRFGGAIVAAVFLREFVDEGIPWAHLDIAGTGRAEKDWEEGPKGATGVPARTLLHWLEGRSNA
jgi:leucyl aminopeptidase